MIVVAEPGLSFDTTIALPMDQLTNARPPWVECPECHTVSIRRDQSQRRWRYAEAMTAIPTRYPVRMRHVPLHYGSAPVVCHRGRSLDAVRGRCVAVTDIDFYGWACTYAEDGYRVFPVTPEEKIPLGRLVPHGCKGLNDRPGHTARMVGG